MKFLIAGSGSIGRRHIRNLQALGEQEIILYRTHQSSMPNDPLADFPVETDLWAALGHQPNAVIISNPTAQHLNVAIPAASAGCHLLIEKPIADTLERVDLLAHNLEETHSRALVGFQFRFHPVLRQIKQILTDESMGRVISAQAHWGEYLPSWHPWEDYRTSYAARTDLGGGVVLTLCHPLDYLRWLIGEVTGVSARVGKISDLELPVEDNAEILLEFANGCVANVHLDYYQQPAEHWLSIITTRGTIQWNNGSGVAEVYQQGEGWSRLEPPSGFERNTLFLDEMRHFIQVVKGTEQPLCTLEDGKRVLEIALAAHASSADGGKVQPV